MAKKLEATKKSKPEVIIETPEIVPEVETVEEPIKTIDGDEIISITDISFDGRDYKDVVTSNGFIYRLSIDEFKTKVG
jgi:hypothetical protein